MKPRLQAQAGMTLVIALIMMAVLTLMVVSAIRFGNINLKITGNTQIQTEASAAAQVGIEGTVTQMIAAADISTIPAKPALAVSTGGASYAVDVNAPRCVFLKPVSTDTLDPSKSVDRNCYEGADTDKLVTNLGNLTVAPSACKDQQWDVAAAVTDGDSGAQVTMLQGAAVRVGAQVTLCP